MGTTYCFENFELKEGSRELRKFGTRIPLQPQPESILLELVREPGQIVRRSHLRSTLWGDNVFVDYERNLNRSINKLRVALGDSADNPRFIETIPGVGYRFIPPVTTRSEGDTNLPTAPAGVEIPPESVKAGGQDLKVRLSFVPATKHTRTAIVSVLVLIVIAGVVLSGAKYRSNSDRIRLELEQRRVVGVLPFDDISDEPSQGHFAEAITEEINEQLCKVPALKVVSRAALSQTELKHQYLRNLATEIGLGSAVVGSVRLVGGRAKVSVQLVEAKTGRTLWSDVYDRDLKDSISMQTEIAFRVVDALRIQLSSIDQARMEKKLTDNAEAYDYYLRGKMVRQPHTQAVDLLREAIRLDPGFAAAYGEMAIRYSFLSAGDKKLVNLGLQAARQAISLDPQLASGHIGLANILGEMGRLREARLSYLSALQLDPNSVEAMANLSEIDLGLGMYDESLYWSSRGLQLARTEPWPYFHVGFALILLGPHDAAWGFLTASERRFPQIGRIQEVLAIEEFLAGQEQASLARLRSVVQKFPTSVELRGEFANVAFQSGSPEAEALLADLVHAAPDYRMGIGYSPGFLYGVLLSRRGARAAANEMIEGAISRNRNDITLGTDNANVFLEMAAINSFQGNRRAALEWLDRAYTAGFRGTRFLDRDPLFSLLNDDPGYQQLLFRMKRDVAEMQARSQTAGLSIRTVAD